MNSRNALLRGLSSEAWNVLEPILNDFERAYGEGQRPLIDDYVERGREFRLPLLMELVQLDLECRLEAGEPASAETYLERYPELAREPDVARDLVAAERRPVSQRRRSGSPATTAPEGEIGSSESKGARADLQRAGADTSTADGTSSARSKGLEDRTGEPPASSNDMESGESPGREADGGFEGVTIVSSRYRVVGEIARGGMGAILKARDNDIGRELAIKVLLKRHRDLAEMERRFVEEAQIGGQLQHPGIVPVYDFGRCVDRRPYFSMKLVQGRTLADLLAARESPAHDLPRFLGIFEQVCQTMAYAHARGVIHRDLKPLNIMVGAFGEVQVMDWGLSKVLYRGGPAGGEIAPGDSDFGEIQTVRSGSDVDASRAGSVLGTPAYMAPEQACGDLDLVDERADIFGLGSILCEVLTGRPAYRGVTRPEILSQAASGNTADALARLDRCEAEAELVALAQQCLAADRAARPRDARVLAAAVTSYQRGVQERLRAAELGRVEAQARAEEEVKRRELADALAHEAQARAEASRRAAAEERRRRRATVSALASLIGMVMLAGGVATWVVRQRGLREAATARVVQEALDEATLARGRARGDLAILAEALQSARRAEQLARSGAATVSLRARVQTVLNQIEREHAAATERADELARDRRLLERLEIVRANGGEHWDPKRTDTEYEVVFREFGLDVDRLDAQQAADWVTRRSNRAEVGFYLDDWAIVRRKTRKEAEANLPSLLAAARAADPDPWRDSLRTQIGRRDLTELQRLADDPETSVSQKPAGLVLLATALRELGDRTRGLRLLGRAWQLQPSDFWLNYELGASWEPNSTEPADAAIRFLSVAVALRPRSFAAHTNLGPALASKGQLDEAIAELRAALRLDNNRFPPHSNLAHALSMKGQYREAVEECRAALRISDWVPTRRTLAEALIHLGKVDEAIAEYREALRRAQGGEAELLHDDLGRTFFGMGKLLEAIAEYRQAIRLKPDYADAHFDLGNALVHQGRPDEAIAEYRQAIRLAPDNAEAHCNLGHELGRQARFREALEELRKGHALGSKQPGWRYPSDQWVREVERFAELEDQLPAFRSGERTPRDAGEAHLLALLCYFKQFYGTSAQFWRDVFRLRTAPAEASVDARYSAACAAALAGCGKGRDDPVLVAKERTQWRAQAHAWLTAELAALRKEFESNKPGAKASVPGRLAQWKVDSDLAGVRDPAGLKNLSADEQKEWRALWTAVDALLSNTSATMSPSTTKNE
jgi:serine/threonine-protein kinase